MLNIDKNVDISDFINACDDFATGKFILADIKISKILKVISSSRDIYDLIAECMINYDFENDLNYAKINEKKPYFSLPEENYKVIPLVFCLLVEIDSKRLNFNEFLSSQFPNCQNQNEEYFTFGNQVIIPFKNAVADVFGFSNEKEYKQESDFSQNVIDKKLYERAQESTLTDVQEDGENIEFDSNNEEEQEETTLLFDRIARITSILDDKLLFVKNPLKKSNLGLLIDAMYDACSYQNVKIVVALIMAINSIANNEKRMKNEIKELNNICYNFYEEQ